MFDRSIQDAHITCRSFFFSNYIIMEAIVEKRTSLPKSLTLPVPENVPTYSHITNKKLRTHLTRGSIQAAQSKELLKDAELLLTNEAGKLEVEGEMEKTWRIGQEEIVKEAGQEAAMGRREWKLDGGPYRCRYTKNGRFGVAYYLRA
jgi:U3 small nucleolar RNA-associated protein 7